jgi:hypothetical protein
MGAGDNSTVKIVIDVIDASSGKVISQTTKNLDSLGNAGAEAGKKVAAGLDEAGAAGAALGPKIGGGMKEAGTHTLTNLDYVRQLRDDLGIRIPRSMEKFIASSAIASQALGALGSGLIALGGIEILARMGTQVYDLYKKFLDTDSIVKDFNKKLAETAQLKFMDIAPIEDVNAKLREVAATIDFLKQKQKDSIGVGGLIGSAIAGGSPEGAAANLATAYSNNYFNKYDADQLNKLTGISDNGKGRQLDDQHARVMQQIADQKTLAGAMRDVGGAKAAREHALAIQEASENASYSRQKAENQNEISDRARLAGIKIAKLDPNSGAQEFELAKQAADAKLKADGIQRSHQYEDEVLRLQREANEAGLKGFQLTQAQEADARKDFVLKYGESKEAMTLIDDRFRKQNAEKLREERAENARLQAEAAQGGLKGIARVDAGVNTQIAGIAKEAPGFSDPATRATREAAARQRGLAEQQQEADQFAERITQLDESRVDSTMSANQKIDAATRRAQAEIRKAWEDTYGQLGALDQRRVQSYQALQGELLRMTQEGEREKQQARQSIGDETAKMEAEAGRRGMTREQEARQAILDEYTQRYRQLEELRTKDADNADLYRREEIAAEEIKNGKLIEEQRQMRDKLAGELRGFMTNPLEALKRAGETAASKFGADLLLKAGGKGAAGSSGPMSHIGGGIFDLPFGHKGGAQTQATISSVTSPSATMKADSATINITGTATFNGAGGMRGAAGPAAGGGGGGGTFDYAGMGHGGGSTFSTTSGSTGDDLGTTGTAGASGPGVSSTSGGFTSTGGPAVAASMGSLGMQDAGVAPKIAGGIEGGFGMAQSTAQLGKMLSKDGSGAAGTFSKAGGALGKAAPALGAAAGLFGAYESNGGVGGALSGALSGAQLGLMIGGPVGAAVGAVAGGIMGALGFGGASKASEYDRTQVQPRLAAGLLGFESGTTGYQQAYEDMNKLDSEARLQTKQWGPGGEREYNGTIKGEIKTAMDRLTAEQKSGRSQYGMSAAQFHGGGLVNGFGDFSTGPNSGFAHLEVGETVMHQQATQTHGDALAMMLGGANRSQMADYYGGGTSPAGGSGDVNMHFHSPDAAGAYNLFMANKHHIRSALNASFAENSGGSDA